MSANNSDKYEVCRCPDDYKCRFEGREIEHQLDFDHDCEDHDGSNMGYEDGDYLLIRNDEVIAVSNNVKFSEFKYDQEYQPHLPNDVVVKVVSKTGEIN